MYMIVAVFLALFKQPREYMKIHVLTSYMYYYFRETDTILFLPWKLSWLTGQMFDLQMVCNAFWLLNLFFKAAEITWMLNESIFLVRMLLYSLDDDFYLWYYLLFGWGKNRLCL